MGQLLICDNCGNVIKDNEEAYNLAIQHMVDFNGTRDQDEMIKRYNKAYDSTNYKTICGTCKKILDYLFSLRKDKMQKILKEIEKSYKPEKLCQCITYEDRGLIVDGKADGICYICGKRKQVKAPLSAEELKKLIEKEEGY